MIYQVEFLEADWEEVQRVLRLHTDRLAKNRISKGYEPKYQPPKPLAVIKKRIEDCPEMKVSHSPLEGCRYMMKRRNGEHVD